jgi:hypothetical protein
MKLEREVRQSAVLHIGPKFNCRFACGPAMSQVGALSAQQINWLSVERPHIGWVKNFLRPLNKGACVSHAGDIAVSCCALRAWHWDTCVRQRN